MRESIRLLGEFVLTQRNIVSPRSKNTSVSMAVWEFDKHTVNRVAIPTQNPKGPTFVARNEGFFRHGLDPSVPPSVWCGDSSGKCAAHELWYDVPYEVMCPQRNEMSNLLVPVALSASSVAFASSRIETMYMDLGTAAGVAARLLLTGSVVRAHHQPGHTPRDMGRSKTVRLSGLDLRPHHVPDHLTMLPELRQTHEPQLVCPGLAAAAQDVDVAKVQEILEKEYQQRVRGPWW